MAETPSCPTVHAQDDATQLAETCRDFPQAGDIVGDFRLVRVLGRGALGTVFLAEQLSLGRDVALKITTIVGEEARTMARLEHDNIVRVYSDRIDYHRGLRITSMQLVCGATLEQIAQRLHSYPRDTWSGRLILSIVDEITQVPTAFDPAALSAREAFSRYNIVEAVCWIGERLAEALAHAHKAGIVHCDVKPGNIMLSQYARPMLLDFNLAIRSDDSPSNSQLVGGTVPYMSPEQLEAHLSHSREQAVSLSEKSDLFSLAVVIYELLAGKRPFDISSTTSDQHTVDRTAQLREPPPPLKQSFGDDLMFINRELLRALSINPSARHETCSDFAQALAHSREMVAVESMLPDPGGLTRLVRLAPFLMLFLLPAIPNILASVLNHAYLFRAVVQRLSLEQKAVFYDLATTYNLVVYPLTISLAAWWVAPVFRRWHRLRDGSVTKDEINDMRRRVLTFTPAVIVLSIFGYSSGLVVYAWGASLAEVTFPKMLLTGFGLSFAFCGLLAATMAAFASEFVVLRVLYPQLCPQGTSLVATAHRELAAHPFRLRRFQLYSCCVPLIASLLILHLLPQELGDPTFESWRVMLMLLILIGIAAMALGMVLSTTLSRIVSILTAEH